MLETAKETVRSLGQHVCKVRGFAKSSLICQVLGKPHCCHAITHTHTLYIYIYSCSLNLGSSGYLGLLAAARG